MKDTETSKAVATLLREAEQAHALYEQTALGGVRDEAWPTWYANFLLQHGLATVLPGAGTAGSEKLAALLREYADEYDQSVTDVPWPDVYAARLEATLAKAT
jgi:hypothetical protein